MSSDDVAIRPMQAADIAVVKGLCHDLGYSPSPNQITERLTLMTASPEHHLLVAVIPDGTVLGFLHAFIKRMLEDAPQAQVQAIATVAEARGRGIGSRLLAAAENWARQQNLDLVTIYCAEHRTETHAFYAARGYDLTVRSSRFQKRLD